MGESWMILAVGRFRASDKLGRLAYGTFGAGE